MKKILKLTIKFFAKILIKFSSKVNAGRYFIDELINAILHKKKTIKHNDLKFNFYVPNRLNFFRVDTFSIKRARNFGMDRYISKKTVYFGI